MHPDHKYLIYLKENNAEGIGDIYRLYATKVKRLIIKNNGDEDEAADVFQEALIDIYKLANNESFVLTCPFEPFLIMVCKRKWINIIKKKSRLQVTNSTDELFTLKDSHAEEVEQAFQQLEQESIVMELLEKMGDSCRTIIKECMSGDSQDKVAERLELSYAYLRKKKSECMKALGKMVSEHPLFKR